MRRDRRSSLKLLKNKEEEVTRVGDEQEKATAQRERRSTSFVVERTIMCCLLYVQKSFLNKIFGISNPPD